MTLLLLALAGLAIPGIIVAARYTDGRSWRRSLIATELHLPVGLQVDDIAAWLDSVAAATYRPRLSLVPMPPIALEVIGSPRGIAHFLLLPKQTKDKFLRGLQAALPGVRMTPQSDYFDRRPYCTVAAEALLTTHRRPLAHERAAAASRALLAALQPVGVGQAILIQWIFTSSGTLAPIASAAGRNRGELPAWLAADDLTDGEAIRAARLKQADGLLLHATLRVGVKASSKAAALALFSRAWGPHHTLNASGVQLIRRWWLWSAWAGARLRQLTVPALNWPLLINSREAAALLPLPVGDVALPGLSLGIARQLPPPPGMPKHGVQIGHTNYPSLHQPLRLAPIDRLQHLHAVGPTGVGKSTLLANMVVQDIADGHGVIVLDPKGDLCTDILDRVPEHRAQDVIVLDPAAEPSVGLNVLQAAHDEHSRELVVDHVIHIWHELYKDFWGPRTEDILRGALLTLINTRAADGSAFTLVETVNLLTDNALRRSVIAQPGVPAGLQSFWQWYQAMKPADRLKTIGPILNKLRAAVLRTPLRLMLGQSNGLDLSQVLADRKVLLVPLSKGTLGAETSGLLGTLLLATVWQAALARVRLPAEARHPIFVYIDEAQDVLKLPVDLADMLAQARGLGVGFTLAHQHLGQIDNKQVKAALLGTVRSQIVFQCLRDDAATLAKSFEPRLRADDLMNLPAFEMAVRPCVNGERLAPLTGRTVPLPPAIRDGQSLARTSRHRYGSARAAVEDALRSRARPPATTDTSSRPVERGTAKPFGRTRRDSTAPGEGS
ncbi:type IV secretion system DNA-binding domain-containing protein [Micromonospora sp. NPDC005172]|uniref:type IV secretory system conjugative DNA transfer family protein n=1 Tax=Micromonospora sp. NPDC005172 TaxID=3156867 RepID=UPI0033B66D0B